MSRIGNKPITIPAGVEVTLSEGNVVTVKGPKGQISRQFRSEMTIAVEENQVVVTRPNNEKLSRSLHGTTAVLIKNMITGVSEGYQKGLEIIGIGYRALKQGNKLVLNMGYSHPVEMEIEEGLELELPSQTEIIVKGINKEQVGQFAANVRAVRSPEPYKGKGIRYKGEHVRRKEGKKAK